MPLYEYTCRKCNNRFEELVRSMSAADARPPCPSCGSKQTAKALSVFAVADAGGKSSAGGDDAPMCGRCGELPGSCQM